MDKKNPASGIIVRLLDDMESGSEVCADNGRMSKSLPDISALHQVAGQLAQLATLAFYQIDMRKEFLIAHAVYHVHKSV